jgi:hypothetical protein
LAGYCRRHGISFGWMLDVSLAGLRSMMEAIVGGGDFTALIAWMDRRCRSRPTDQIGIAALDLAMELAGNAVKR